MKKRMLALVLVLGVCMAVCAPALAVDLYYSAADFASWSASDEVNVMYVKGVANAPNVDDSDDAYRTVYGETVFVDPALSNDEFSVFHVFTPVMIDGVLSYKHVGSYKIRTIHLTDKKPNNGYYNNVETDAIP
ncbi:hypothetical protein LJC27_05460 [Christensenellaceae bacterium OttesenSCG-928-M15]|nr:hypothetical protein [Christensenellaceae bacterium OttesenSCG-928-M15]